MKRTKMRGEGGNEKRGERTYCRMTSPIQAEFASGTSLRASEVALTTAQAHRYEFEFNQEIPSVSHFSRSETLKMKETLIRKGWIGLTEVVDGKLDLALGTGTVEELSELDESVCGRKKARSDIDESKVQGVRVANDKQRKRHDRRLREPSVKETVDGVQGLTHVDLDGDKERRD